MILLPLNIVLYILAILLMPLWSLVHWVYWRLHPELAKERRRQRNELFKSLMKDVPEPSDADKELDQRSRERGIPVLGDVLNDMLKEIEAEEAKDQQQCSELSPDA